MKINSSLLFLLSACFFGLVLLSSISPFDTGPDEFNHFHIVEFISQKSRLPIFNQDENMGFTCKPDGKCSQSYSIWPPLPYIFQALFVKLIPGVSATNLYLSARIANVFAALIYTFFTYQFLFLFFKKENLALLGAFLSTFHPQFFYTSSYVNSDTPTNALSAFLLFAFMKQSSLLLGLGSGLILLSRYNAYVLLPLIFLASLVQQYQQTKNTQTTAIFALKYFLVAFLISSWWFIRNIFLYQEILPLKTFYAIWPESIPTIPLVNLPQAVLNIFTQTNYLVEFTRTFFLGLKMNSIRFSDNLTLILTIVYLTGLILSFKTITKKNGLYYFVFISSIVLIFSMAAINSVRYSYQPQGRYLFPILPLIHLLLIKGLFSLKFKPLNQTLITLFLTGGTIILNFYSFYLLARAVV